MVLRVGDKSEKSPESKPLDFVHGFYEGGLARPVAAIEELTAGKVGQTSPRAREPESLAFKSGLMAGQIVDMGMLALVSHGALKPVLKNNINEVSGTSAKMFLAGALQGGLFTSSENKMGRLENAAVDGLTFASMGGGGKAMEKVKFTENALADGILRSGLSGAGAGAVSALAGAGLREHRMAGADEIASSAAQFAVFNLGFHALGEGASRFVANPRVRDAYYRTRWDIEQKTVDMQRGGYSLLNSMNMRHPLHRLGDLVFGAAKIEQPRPQLTAENNPVSAFERHYQRYVEDLTRLEEKYNSAPRGEKHDVYHEINERKSDFAHDLLVVYRGKGEAPGMMAYSDSELATGGHSIERVQAIRKALESPMHRENHRSDSPFEAAMAKLGPEVEARDPFELTMGLESAKEKFWNISDRELSNRLALGQPYHAVSRNYGTPISWMPFESTAKLSNLFHGTISKGLDSILEERAMLSSYDLRLRGIKHETGESAGQEFPRKDISMSRDFSVAYSYTRHQPSLIDYPVVFGISRDVTDKAFLAGMLEPGELLIRRLKLGSDWRQALGLRKPEITHIFVPDSEVPNLTQALSAHRIRGVNVVGFNDIDTPVWTPAEQMLRDLGYTGRWAI